jgi:dihydrofolate reductase
MINIIAAMSKNRVIGNNNTLIWKLPNDMKRFKELTSGHIVIMGRKTFESIGKPLTNRLNVVITRNPHWTKEGVLVTNSLESALKLSSEGKEIFIIGGGDIYKQSLKFANRIYFTVIDEEFDGDTTFPEIGNEWLKTSKIDFKSNEKNNYNYSFIEYEKYDF